MLMMHELYGCLLVVLLVISDTVLGGEYCFHYRDGIKYCDYGCCGRTLQEYCCLLAVWIIVLLVMGGILLLSVVVFIFLFNYCKKRGRTNGRVVYPGSIPTQTQTVSTVHTVQYQGQVYPTAPPPYTAITYPYGQPAPPPYQQHQEVSSTSHLFPAVYDPDRYCRNQPLKQAVPQHEPANPTAT